MDGTPLTWALLAPVRRGRLDDLAQEYWRDEVSDSDEDYAEEGWEVIGGARDYSAILDRNPGSEYTHDVPLAERLSRELKRPVYVLYLNERLADADAVAVYENGQRTGQRPLPYELARSLGITLPGDEESEREGAAGVPRRPVRGVVVIEGVPAAEVARTLDMSEPPRGPVHIVDGPAGAIMYNEASDHTPPVSRRLSRAFPEANVYTLGTGPREGRFVARVTRAGEDVGAFESPVPGARDSRTPTLDSVKGETTPRGIAARLGVPQGLMDLP